MTRAAHTNQQSPLFVKIVSTIKMEQMNELALFAGAGGGLLGSRLLGWRTRCAVEIETYCQDVLLQRQRDGHLEPFPIWDNIKTFDGYPWRGVIDVVSGGFPCQDISSAGRGEGLSGARSGLWFEMLRVIGEVQPAYVFAENSPMLRTRGLPVVLEGLASLGYDACWGVLGAWHVGAPHKRNRMWIVAAHPDRCRERKLTQHAEVAGAQGIGGDVTCANGSRLQQSQSWGTGPEAAGTESRSPNDWWGVHRFAGVDDGMANRMVRIKCTGNGQVPRVAEVAWKVLRP
jgi:DNA (cytosine-5)-methyltransferase 1